jgi:hypothetical protein
MQRPESVKTRGSTAAAAELERKQEEEDDWKREEWKTQVVPIYKGGPTETARETRRPSIIIQRPRRLGFRDGQ